MYDITVITPTIGRRSIRTLIQSLLSQNVKVLHLILWDSKRCEDGYSPEDPVFTQYHGVNYMSYHYVLLHPIYKITRIDNYLRTIGIQMSTTEYTTQIDDDCWLEPNWLSVAIHAIQTTPCDYCFCRRYLWENDTVQLGIDDYESIGETNRFGYQLIETNSLVFPKKLNREICNVTYLHNDYGHDRFIAEYLFKNGFSGLYTIFVGLNQIIPGFLCEFHRINMESTHTIDKIL